MAWLPLGCSWLLLLSTHRDRKEQGAQGGRETGGRQTGGRSGPALEARLSFLALGTKKYTMTTVTMHSTACMKTWHVPSDCADRGLFEIGKRVDGCSQDEEERGGEGKGEEGRTAIGA